MTALSTGRTTETLAEQTGGGPVDRQAAGRSEGRLSSLLRRLFMRRATVATCEQIAEGFHLIALESPDFRGLDWTPGDKIQITLGSAFMARTYTPIEWEHSTGRTRIIAWDHGSGPASDWIRGLRTGDVCDIFGPRASLDVSWIPGPVLLFGDETSFGLALAMRRQGYAATAEFLFEVSDVAESRRLLNFMNFGACRLFNRQPDDGHFAEIEARLRERAASGATFVFTGRSVAIQHMRRVLKGLSVPAERLMTKAYWAPGKTGLD